MRLFIFQFDHFTLNNFLIFLLTLFPKLSFYHFSLRYDSVVSPNIARDTEISVEKMCICRPPSSSTNTVIPAIFPVDPVIPTILDNFSVDLSIPLIFPLNLVILAQKSLNPVTPSCRPTFPFPKNCSMERLVKMLSTSPLTILKYLRITYVLNTKGAYLIRNN